MEKANQILSIFLYQQRSTVNLHFADVAKFIGYPVEQIEAWEKQPVKAPLCAIARLVKLYKTPGLTFSKTFWNVQKE